MPHINLHLYEHNWMSRIWTKIGISLLNVIIASKNRSLSLELSKQTTRDIFRRNFLNSQRRVSPDLSDTVCVSTFAEFTFFQIYLPENTRTVDFRSRLWAADVEKIWRLRESRKRFKVSGWRISFLRLENSTNTHCCKSCSQLFRARFFVPNLRARNLNRR